MPSDRVRLLFVCLGNICRSPLAAAVFAHCAAARGVSDRFEVESCGTGDWHVGGPADPRTIAVASRHGVAMTHQARQLTPARDVGRFALILAMDARNRRDLLALGAPANSVRLIREFDPAFATAVTAPDVPDPYSSPDQAFEDVFQMLIPACQGLIDEMLPGAPV